MRPRIFRNRQWPTLLDKAPLHPVVKTGAAQRIARLKIRTIVAIYLIFFAVFDTILAIAIAASKREGVTLERYSRYFLLAMLSPADILDARNDTLITQLAVYVAEAGRVIFPVFLLGAFVFKLFRIDPLTWRSKLSIESQLGGEPPVLRIRFYNSTSSPLVNLTIQVFARIRSTGEPRSVQNVELKISQGADRNTRLGVFWALGRPGVPFTVSVPLGLGLSAKDVFDKDQIVLPDHAETIDRSRVNLFVLTTGKSLETGVDFSSGHEYSLAEDLLLGHYAEIDVVYNDNPRTWRGWQWFEENRELFVFGYASLASPDSVALTVGHDVDASTFTYAKLAGWKREWSVGSDKSSHPERTFRRPDGSEYPGVVVVMGISQVRTGEGCDGAVFPASRRDLTVLDVRERNYERIDVSSQVTWAGKPEGCLVYTYVPTIASLERVDNAIRDHKEIGIRSTYLHLVRAAFGQPGFPDVKRPELELLPYSVLELETEIDTTIEPVKRATLNSSYFQ